MTTKHDGVTISHAQEVAIAALIRGASVTVAAAEAGVARQTVSGWKNHNPEFIATLNRCRRDVWDQVEDRIRALHIKVIDVITLELDGSAAGNVAIEVMKVLGRMNSAPTGATTARESANEHTLRDMLAF